MTTLTTKMLVQGTLLTTSATALYTAPSGGSDLGVMIRDIYVTNYNSGTTIGGTVYTGSSAGNAQTILPGTYILVGGNHWYRHSIFLPAGESIYGKASSNAYLSMQVSGVECTGAWSNGITPKRLVQADLPTATGAALYTCGVTKTILKDVVFANRDSSARTVTFDLVASGGSIGNASKLLYTYSIAARELLQFKQSIVMHNGDALYAVTSSAGTVSLNISGVEIT